MIRHRARAKSWAASCHASRDCLTPHTAATRRVRGRFCTSGGAGRPSASAPSSITSGAASVWPTALPSGSAWADAASAASDAGSTAGNPSAPMAAAVSVASSGRDLHRSRLMSCMTISALCNDSNVANGLFAQNPHSHRGLCVLKTSVLTAGKRRALVAGARRDSTAARIAVHMGALSSHAPGHTPDQVRQRPHLLRRRAG